MKLRVVGDLECLHCGYNLRGLIGPGVMCPECQSLNDLRDATPWRNRLHPAGLTNHIPNRVSDVMTAAFLIMPIGGFKVSSWVTGPVLLESTSFTIALMLVTCFWFNRATRFLQAWTRPAAAIQVLIALHVGILLAALALMLFLSALMKDIAWGGVWFADLGWAPPLVLAGLSTLLFTRAHRMVSRSRRTGIYRIETQQYRLPVEEVPEFHVAPEGNSAAQLII
ncbi:MAG: hypothetical protein ACOC0P_04270 [Planctomycetota bacterium]